MRRSPSIAPRGRRQSAPMKVAAQSLCLSMANAPSIRAAMAAGSAPMSRRCNRQLAQAFMGSSGLLWDPEGSSRALLRPCASKLLNLDIAITIMDSGLRHAHHELCTPRLHWLVCLWLVVQPHHDRPGWECNLHADCTSPIATDVDEYEATPQVKRISNARYECICWPGDTRQLPHHIASLYCGKNS